MTFPLWLLVLTTVAFAPLAALALVCLFHPRNRHAWRVFFAFQSQAHFEGHRLGHLDQDCPTCEERVLLEVRSVYSSRTDLAGLPPRAQVIRWAREEIANRLRGEKRTRWDDRQPRLSSS